MTKPKSTTTTERDNIVVNVMKGGPKGKGKSYTTTTGQLRAEQAAARGTLDERTFLDPAIIICGPSGIDKSRFICEIAAIFGRDPEDVIDDWSPDQVAHRNCIHLTNASMESLRELPTSNIVTIDVRSLRLQPIPGGSIPQDEPFTCGTGHLKAQAVLRLAQQTMRNVGRVTPELLDCFDHLVDQAGWKFALEIIGTAADPLDDEIPF